MHEPHLNVPNMTKLINLSVNYRHTNRLVSNLRPHIFNRNVAVNIWCKGLQVQLYRYKRVQIWPYTYKLLVITRSNDTFLALLHQMLKTTT